MDYTLCNSQNSPGCWDAQQCWGPKLLLCQYLKPGHYRCHGGRLIIIFTLDSGVKGRGHVFSSLWIWLEGCSLHHSDPSFTIKLFSLGCRLGNIVVMWRLFYPPKHSIIVEEEEKEDYWWTAAFVITRIAGFLILEFRYEKDFLGRYVPPAFSFRL